MRKQNEAPIFEAIQKHMLNRPLPFHVPGHQMGNAFDALGHEVFANVLPYDLTEISGLDDLHQPEGVIAEAQRLAAECFQADETFFLVGGSTVGNMAMILSACEPGDTIILPRSVHKSVLHGCMLAKVKPVYLQSRIDESTQVNTIPSMAAIHTALDKYPKAKALLLTCPNYYGMGMDLEKVSSLIHRYGIPLLIDEAHGAHYGFHPSYPKSAMQQGADAVVQSTHKMLTSLTMGAMLHLQGSRLDRHKMKRWLGILQTSSPSYLILASLDLARRQLWQEGDVQLGRVMHAVEVFKSRLNRASEMFEAVVKHDNSAYDTLDPCKLTIHIRDRHVTGFALKGLLEKHAIYIELADMHNVVLVCTMGTTDQSLNILYDTLMMLEKNIRCRPENMKELPPPITNIPLPSYEGESGLPLDEVLLQPSVAVPLHEAAGRVSAELIIPYPPGIPVIAWGERLTAEMIRYIDLLKQQGATFQGVSDPTLSTLRVVANAHDA